MRLVDNLIEDEKAVAKKLLESLNFLPLQANNISVSALEYVKKIRASKRSGIEAFIQQYSLSTEEGIAIMCLAEALLRIPDKKTANLLLQEKLKDKNWGEYLGKSDSFFVNASTWGLLISGKILKINNYGSILKNTFARLSSPTLLAATEMAIKVISNEFILGETLPSAIKNAKKYFKKGYRVSFDILGESSRTQTQADYYYNAYIKALDEISIFAAKSDNLFEGPNLSVKLTALHPKVTLRQEKRLVEELLPKLITIVEKCQKLSVSISFDAEEAFRQDIYLIILEKLHRHPTLKKFNGIGFVIQGYQKRTFNTIDFIIDLARDLGKIIPVRLVKGAYWDSEIKFAQENGLEGYPVFTRKEFTDVSYLACAQKILANSDVIFPQFATHNAYTIASIKEMAGHKNFEFQKLQGMGDVLHDIILKEGYKSRIYAPVGKYDDLLAYLMRRLLENGANTSFINLVGNKSISERDLVNNQIESAKNLLDKPLKISIPKDIYSSYNDSSYRDNSLGYDLGYQRCFKEHKSEIEKFKTKSYEAHSIINGKKVGSLDKKEVFNPANHSQKIGVIHKANALQIKQALDIAHNSFDSWANTEVSIRTKKLRKIAELMQKNRYELYHLLITEAGKNIEDAIAEVREAIDFAYYYAHMAEKLCKNPILMPSYTGESNELSLHPKGVFVCISPWNFPLAIFCGQILAALAAGNTVIAKSAENTSLVAHFAASLMFEAGIPASALQFTIVSGKILSETIISDDRVKGVCFTGSNKVALGLNRLLASRNTGPASFIAETGGQNAMIIDSSALLEQATDSIVTSAFVSAGQRCSALRVAYVQEEIFDKLYDLICGAMNELKVGIPSDFSVDIGPVISEGSKKELQDHIDWLQNNKFKILAKHKSHAEFASAHGSFFVPHIAQINNISDLKSENFGPILHLISFKSEDLDKVIDEINNTGFGLTFGLQTRIESRVDYVASKIKAGNFYANRTMTGAHVGTHPFGGEGNSGTGFKAGGPHYLLKFLNERVKTVNLTAIGGNIQLLS